MREARPGSRWSAGRVLRRARYSTYITSEAWFRRREQWHEQFVREHGHDPVCAICDREWTPSRGDLHHGSYDRLGHERHTDLVPLCRTDHARLHDVWDAVPGWRCLGHAQATAGIIAALRRQRKGPTCPTL